MEKQTKICQELFGEGGNAIHVKRMNKPTKMFYSISQSKHAQHNECICFRYDSRAYSSGGLNVLRKANTCMFAYVCSIVSTTERSLTLVWCFHFSHLDRKMEIYIQFYSSFSFKMGFYYHEKGIWCFLTFISQKITQHAETLSSINSKRPRWRVRERANRGADDYDGSCYLRLYATWLWFKQMLFAHVLF